MLVWKHRRFAGHPLRFEQATLDSVLGLSVTIAADLQILDPDRGRHLDRWCSDYDLNWMVLGADSVPAIVEAARAADDRARARSIDPAHDDDCVRRTLAAQERRRNLRSR